MIKNVMTGVLAKQMLFRHDWPPNGYKEHHWVHVWEWPHNCFLPIVPPKWSHEPLKTSFGQLAARPKNCGQISQDWGLRLPNGHNEIYDHFPKGEEGFGVLKITKKASGVRGYPPFTLGKCQDFI